MKITDVAAYPVQGEHRVYMVVVVDTDEGHYGLGEAGLSGQEPAVAGAVRCVRDLLVGQDPFRSEWLWQMMWRAGFFPATGATAAAAAAVDIALWDIKGKALGQPVYNLLGGRVRDSVACYVHIGTDTFDIAAAVADATAKVAAGWRHLRLTVPDNHGVLEPELAVRNAVGQFAAVREAVGTDIELIIDVHTRLGLPDAVRLCEQLAPYRPYFIEDPLRSEYLQLYRQLRARTTAPLAAGEQLYSKWEFRTLIEEDLIDFARIDVCLAGGLTESAKIAAMAETHGVRVAVHNPLGVVSTAACLHFNLALTPFGVQEQSYAPGSTDLQMFPVQQMSLHRGAATAKDAPGLGVEVDREALAASAAHRNFLPTLRRADGSFTNW